MRVVEAGQDGGALRIDRRRLRPAQPEDLAVAADPENLVAADRHRLGHVPSASPVNTTRVVDDQIDRPVAVVPLRADDEAGDQRDGDDADDDDTW